jgi:transcriptional regulator with XRE-family HTH domain
VIVVARRRAGLTQQQLARRLDMPQVTIARWESGATEPKFDAVQRVVGACGYDLTLGFENADEGSWNSLIYEQLLRTPADRLRKLTRGGTARTEALKLVGASALRAIVVGETAGALHGWPLVLDGPGGIDLLVHEQDRPLLEDVLAHAPARKRIHLIEQLPGAWGYEDLARNAVRMDIDRIEVRVAALVDLLRVALSERGGFSGEFALAFDATLQLSERLRRPEAMPASELTEQEARKEADKWMAQHTRA